MDLRKLRAALSALLLAVVARSPSVAQYVATMPVVSAVAFPTANLKLQYEADCITLSAGVCSTPSDGTNITAWADQSGNANNLSLASGTCTFHTNQLNGKPAVTFSSCHWNLASSITAECCHQLFVVMKLTSLSGYSELLNGASGACGWTYNQNNEQEINVAGNVRVGNGTAAADTNWHQLNGLYKNGTQPTFRLDRASDATVNGTTNNCTVALSVIGYDKPTTSANFAGQVVAMIYYQNNNSGVTLVDATQVETYLHQKYGL